MTAEPWTPENNRIQTMHLTADELAALRAAIETNGAFRVSHHGVENSVDVVTWDREAVYRAKPAPVTQDVIRLRNCPMCHTAPGDEGVMLTAENLIDPKTGEEYGNIGYTVRCCMCGASVADEYRDEVVRLWNGELVADDEEADSLQQRPVTVGAVTEPLAVGAMYWAASVTHSRWCYYSTWDGDETDMDFLKRGLIHLTEADAVAAAKAMCAKGGV